MGLIFHYEWLAGFISWIFLPAVSAGMYFNVPVISNSDSASIHDLIIKPTADRLLQDEIEHDLNSKIDTVN